MPKQVGEIAEGAEDGKAGDKRCQAVGDADEEHVEDDVLAKASLFPMNTKRFATDLVELVEAGQGEHGGVASAEGEEDTNTKRIGTLSVKIIIVANIIKIIKIIKIIMITKVITTKPHLSEKRICPAASVQICRSPSFDHSGTQSQEKHRGVVTSTAIQIFGNSSNS